MVLKGTFYLIFTHFAVVSLRKIDSLLTKQKSSEKKSLQNTTYKNILRFVNSTKTVVCFGRSV